MHSPSPSQHTQVFELNDDALCDNDAGTGTPPPARKCLRVPSFVRRVVETEPDEVAQMPAPALGQCCDCQEDKKPGDLCDAGCCEDCCDGASCWPSHRQGIGAALAGAAPTPTTASPAATASASPTAREEHDDCTYNQEEVQDAARAYMEDSTNFRSDSTNSESWDGLVDAIAEKFDEVEPGATAHASCCLWGLSSIVWQHLQTIFGIALCVKCLTPRSQPVSRLLERDQRHHQEQRQHQQRQHQCGYKWFQQPEYHSTK